VDCTVPGTSIATFVTITFRPEIVRLFAMKKALYINILLCLFSIFSFANTGESERFVPVTAQANRPAKIKPTNGRSS
jgi:hypothetical protein